MKKKTRSILKWVIGIVITVVVLAAFCRKPYDMDDLKDAQSDLISASGILAGILIAFLSTKLFQLADDGNKSRIILNEYADKLTQFRKLLFRVMKLHDFWVYRGDITRFKKEEPTATFHDLHGDVKESKALRKKFWLDEEENPIHHTTIDLYLAMEEITSNSDKNGYWVYDANTHYEYELEYLRRAEMPSNQIWYYLDGRYPKHTKGQIKDTGFSTFELDDLNSLIASIDPKFQEREFDRVVIADIGTYFYKDIIPKMIRLTQRRAQRLTSSIASMLMSLILVMVSGVFMPLVFEILNLGETERLTTAVCVTTVIISLVVFLIDLMGLALDDEQSITDRDHVMVNTIQV